MVGLLESRFSVSFQRKAGIHLPRRQIVVSLIILLPTTHQIQCEWIWGVLVGSPLYARQVSVWLCSNLEILHRFKQVNLSQRRWIVISPKLLPYVLIHIYYKKVHSISQRSPVQWRVETWLVVSSRGFPRRFKGRQVFTYHDGRLLSHWLSFYQQRTRNHVNGFGGCWWGLHFMWGKYRYGCAPVWRSSHCFEQEFLSHRR
jgi:hypothetical protein